MRRSWQSISSSSSSSTVTTTTSLSAPSMSVWSRGGASWNRPQQQQLIGRLDRTSILLMRRNDSACMRLFSATRARGPHWYTPFPMTSRSFWSRSSMGSLTSLSSSNMASYFSSAVSNSNDETLVTTTTTTTTAASDAQYALQDDDDKEHSQLQQSPLLPRTNNQTSVVPAQRLLSPAAALQVLLDSSPDKKNRRQLLSLVTHAGNLVLLEKATRTLDWIWHDADCLQLLVTAWARLPSASGKNHNNGHNGASITGAVVAAQLLHEWVGGKRQQRLPNTTSNDKDKNHISYPSLATFRTVLTALAAEGNYPVAARVLQLLTKIHKADRDVFHRVLQACSSQGALDAALQWYQEMQLFHVQPNASTLKLVLQTHVEHYEKFGTKGTGVAAYQFYQEFSGTKDQVALNMTLNALAQEGRYDLACELLEHAACQDDPIPLRTVLKACSQARTIQAAELAQDLVARTPTADARAYTTIVAIWCQLGYPERAKTVLEELVTLYLEHKNSADDPHKNRFQPDPLSFRTVIGALSQKIIRLTTSPSGNSKSVLQEAAHLAAQAQQVFVDDMYTTMGYEPNLLTLNTVLNCWAQARQPEAVQELLQQVQSWGITPDIVSYNTLIACHAKLGNVQECTMWLSRLVVADDAEQQQMLPPPNTRTVTAVITALAKRGTVQAATEAEGWFTQMQEWHADYGWDCWPNVVTLNALLSGWARVGDGARAEAWLRHFQQQHHQHNNKGEQQAQEMEPPNQVSYNTVMQAYGDDIHKVEHLLEELVAVGLQPTERTVQIAQQALERHYNDDVDNKSNKEKKWKEWKQRFFYYVAKSNNRTATTTVTTNKQQQQQQQRKKNKKQTIHTAR